MRPIDKFILYTVHNLFSLNEYSDGEIKKLIDKFREEADDFDIEITDEQLKNYIVRFDQLKNSPKIKDKDLRQYSLSKLIKLVTASKGADVPEQYDITPDVVYNENGLIIYNGSRESNCLNFGRGESWCITKTSFGNYRYASDKKHATFYLVRDTNQQVPPGDTYSDVYRKSFFVVVVGSDQTYKVSDRTNNDVGGRGTEWDRWENWSFVEQHFPVLRGLERIFKYIPLSNSEKITQNYKVRSTSIKRWMNLPYNVKEQYLVVRQGKSDLFNDISTDDFINRYIEKYPQIASFIAANFGIIPSEILIRHLDKFSNQDTRSIIANMREPVSRGILTDPTVPFEAKQIVVRFNKIKTDKIKFYNTQDNKAIVGLVFNPIRLKYIITEDEEFENVKINSRTIKYILEYPDLINQVTVPEWMDLVRTGGINSETFKKYIDKIKENPENNKVKIIPIENENEFFILYIPTFMVYKVSDTELLGIYNYDSEEFQSIISNNPEVNDELKDSYKQRLLNLITDGFDLPESSNRDSVVNLIRSIPISERTYGDNTNTERVLLTSNENPYLFITYANPGRVTYQAYVAYGESPERWYVSDGSKLMDEIMWRVYFTYLRLSNKTFTDDNIISILNSGNSSRIAFTKAGPPLGSTNSLIPVMNGDEIFVINRHNVSQSKKTSSHRSGLIQAPLNVEQATAMIRNMTATVQQAQPGQPEQPIQPIQPTQPNPGGARGRGRPRRGEERPQPQRPTPPPGQGVQISSTMEQYGLTRGYDSLHRGVRNRLSSGGVRGTTTGDRGVSRRDNLLGGTGTVVSVYDVGASTVYFIQLRSGTYIASIVIQPGNGHYVITSDTSYQLRSPSELMALLNQQNIREAHRYFINDFLGRNPHKLDEFKSLLRKHISENKNK